MTSETIDERAAFDAWAVKHGRVVGYNGWRNDFEVWQARALLAAPEAPRQEPVTMDGKTTIREYAANALPENWPMDEWTKGYEECKRRIHAMFMQPINAPLSPDHSGGGAGVVLPKPDIWRIPVSGNWFYGTKEQCEREYAEYTADFTAEDFDEDGPHKPEPLACLDKVKELNQ